MKPICVTIGHVNVNRLRHKIDFVKNIIIKHKFSILAVTETWLDNQVSHGEVAIDNYRLLRRDRSGRAGGVVCVYVHNSYKIREQPNISHPSLEWGYSQNGACRVCGALLQTGACWVYGWLCEAEKTHLRRATFCSFCLNTLRVIPTISVFEELEKSSQRKS